MRKFICLILIVVIAASFCGCGNMNIGIGNFNFTHAHIGLGNESHCFDVISWVDNEIGIELMTMEAGSIYCAEGTYLLFEDSSNCPFCN